MIVADTSAWIDYFNGIIAPHTNRLHEDLAEERIIIGDIIIIELLQGFRADTEYRTVSTLIDSLEYRDFMGKDMAIKAADNYRYLRKKGITVRKTIDVIIASFCIDNGYYLIHNDKDFDPFEKHLGLQVRR